MSRRTAAAICQIASPIVFVVAISTYAAAFRGQSTPIAAASAHPADYGIAALLECISGALAVPGALAVMRRLEGRGRVLGLLGAIGAVLGAIFLGAGVMYNELAVTLGQSLPSAQAQHLLDVQRAKPAVVVVLTCYLLSLLGSLLLLIGAVRGHLVRAWLLVFAVIGIVGNAGADNPGPLAIAATVLAAVPAIALGVALLRTRDTAPVDVTLRHPEQTVAA